MSDPLVRSNQIPAGALASPAQSTQWSLVRRAQETDMAQTIAIDTFPFRIGRSEEVSLQLAFSAVSSQHAELFLQEGRLMVRDLGSTNGTFVNGAQISEAVELSEGSILQIAHFWMHVRKLVQQPALASAPITPTIVNDASDGALALTRFPDLLRDRAFTFSFEPVVDLQTGENIAHVGIAESRIFGLTTQLEMNMAARSLNRNEEFCRVLRTEQLRAFESLNEPLPLFVNLEPWETTDSQALALTLRVLREQFPGVSIHLNAHPDACFAVETLTETRRMIADLNMQISLDDFGDGQSRLVELTELSPYCVWFENRFADNLSNTSSERLRLTKGLIDMVAALGAKPAIKGIATEADAAICKDLGFVLAQGPLFANKPREAAEQSSA